MSRYVKSIFEWSRKSEIPKKWWNSEQKKRFANQPIGVRHPSLCAKLAFFFKYYDKLTLM